jgi:hypothetical protein
MFLYDLKNGGNKFIWMFAEVWTLKLKSVPHHHVSPDYLFTKNCWGFKTWSVFFCDCQNGRNKFIWMFIEVWTFELKSVSHHHLSLNYLLTKIAGALILKKSSCVTSKMVRTTVFVCLLRCGLLS